MNYNKVGLDYYEHYIGMTNDEKIVDLRMEFGSVAIDVWLTLLDLIYSDKGYYIEYNAKTKNRVVWKILGVVRGKDTPSPETVSDIISALVECGLFSGELFNAGILSSKRIQEHYYKATVERKAVDIITGYWLLDIDRMKKLSEKSSVLRFFQNRTNPDENHPVTGENRTIIKQSRVEKIREEDSTEEKSSSAEVYVSAAQQVFDLFNRICVSFPKVSASGLRVDAVNDRLSGGVGIDDFERLFIKAQDSDFLKGKNRRRWAADFDWLIKDMNMAKTLDGHYDNREKKKYSYDLDEYKALVNNFG